MKTLRDVGVRPLLQGILLWVFVAAGSVANSWRLGLSVATCGGLDRSATTQACCFLSEHTQRDIPGDPWATNCDELLGRASRCGTLQRKEDSPQLSCLRTGSRCKQPCPRWRLELAPPSRVTVNGRP